MTSEKEMKSEMYSQYAREYDFAIQNNIYNAHFERPSLQAMIGEVDGKNVLDLGCGSGIYAKYLLDKGAKVTSIDISREMIDIVKEIRRLPMDLPILVHANAGLPKNVDGVDIYPETPEQMAKFVLDIVKAGVNIIGGCCGTTPEHIKMIKDAVNNL